MRSRLLAFVIAIVLAGCAATAPPVAPNTGKLAKGAKVGVLVYMPSPAQHLHVGTTVFNNFSTNYPFPWTPTSRAYEVFASDLEKAGFQVVRLSSFATSTVDALAVSADGRWIANPKQEWAARKLREEQISAVVLVEGKRTLARLECTGGPCAESYMANSGLFTRSMLGMTRYFAVPAVEAKVFIMDPPMDLMAYEPMRTMQARRVRQLDNFPEPRDFKRLSNAEFAPVAASIDAHLRSLSRSAAQALSNGVK
ncbi:hypothetical protein VAPA_2c02450 [Variovorax paradoxus B4]|uniref:Lipoprotein n=2 Tax=Variovorax paradoxus TaxID=34073 RepID=A0A0H2M5F3_VARPD|nr:hypothetical protein [Variovorax paradoxus]AGU52806.1 hypothetical protein VAPA_2c02450 [Variovorax paradoxus B4]KLN57391.1 hypothetical protein VPARA_14710 [Variovorax paradoxus]